MDPATADLWSTAGCEIALQSYESHDEAQWVMECWIPELPLELNDSRLEGHSRSDERRDAKCRALRLRLLRCRHRAGFTPNRPSSFPLSQLFRKSAGVALGVVYKAEATQLRRSSQSNFCPTTSPATSKHSSVCAIRLRCLGAKSSQHLHYSRNR